MLTLFKHVYLLLLSEFIKVTFLHINSSLKISKKTDNRKEMYFKELLGFIYIGTKLNKKTLTAEAVKNGLPIPQITFFGCDAIGKQSTMRNQKCLILSHTFYFRGEGE